MDGISGRAASTAGKQKMKSVRCSRGGRTLQVRISAFRRTLEARKRIDRAAVEFAAQDRTQDHPAPSCWEAKVAMIVDPAPGVVERNAFEIFANLDAEGQMHVEPEPVSGRIDNGSRWC